MTQAGPPGCCFLLAKMIGSGMNMGPPASQSEPKGHLLEHLGKRNSILGAPTWKQCL